MGTNLPIYIHVSVSEDPVSQNVELNQTNDTKSVWQKELTRALEHYSNREENTDFITGAIEFLTDTSKGNTYEDSSSLSSLQITLERDNFGEITGTLNDIAIEYTCVVKNVNKEQAVQESETDVELSPDQYDAFMDLGFVVKEFVPCINEYYAETYDGFSSRFDGELEHTESCPDEIDMDVRYSVLNPKTRVSKKELTITELKQFVLDTLSNP